MNDETKACGHNELEALRQEGTALREALERANEGVRYWTDLAQAEARDAAALRAQVAVARAKCESAMALFGALYAQDVLRAMDEAAKEKL